MCCLWLWNKNTVFIIKKVLMTYLCLTYLTTLPLLDVRNFFIYISGNSITDLVVNFNGTLLCLVEIKISVPFNFPFQKRGHFKIKFYSVTLIFYLWKALSKLQIEYNCIFIQICNEFWLNYILFRTHWWV